MVCLCGEMSTSSVHGDAFWVMVTRHHIVKTNKNNIPAALTPPHATKAHFFDRSLQLHLFTSGAEYAVQILPLCLQQDKKGEKRKTLLYLESHRA